MQLPRKIILAILLFGLRLPAEEPQPRNTSNFSTQNLVAWCIVPFDAKQRGPAARAEMVKRLGLRRVAYDWREKHVATFEEEILQYKKYGIEFFAFWSWHDALEPLIEKHNIQPQIWSTNPSPENPTQAGKVREAAEAMLPLVKKTEKLDLKMGLYNHGGWGGQPENLLAVCEFLRAKHQARHVGIVYNFHHGHEHIDDFSKSLRKMQPYLHCLNLNGMVDQNKVISARSKKILPIGSGKYEREMIKVVMESGYDGPIGILDHRDELDAELSLTQNLVGLKHLLESLQKEIERPR